MKIRFLENDQKAETRPLYEEAFPDDSKRFVDCFYSVETPGNRVTALYDDELVSMMHLHPVRFVLDEISTDTVYIIAVATYASQRKKGYYRKLLEFTLQQLYEEGMPFVFLMPAAEEIYHPFGFRTVHSFGTRRVPAFPHSSYEFREVADLTEEMTESMEDMLDGYLHIEHDAEWRRRCLPVLRAQGGSLVEVIKSDIRFGWIRVIREDGQVTVLDLIGCVGEEETVLEAFAAKEGSDRIAVHCTASCVGEPGLPILRYMFRILRIEDFADLLDPVTEFDFRCTVHDCIIKENNMTFQFVSDGKTVQVHRINDASALHMDIGELMNVLLKYNKITIPMFHEVV